MNYRAYLLRENYFLCIDGVTKHDARWPSRYIDHWISIAVQDCVSP